MKIKITIEIWKKNKWFVAKCPELDFISQGPTPDEAKKNLIEVINIQFEEMMEQQTLEDYLEECGFTANHDVIIPNIEMIAAEKCDLQVAYGLSKISSRFDQI